jgi:hypothetical protein
LGYYTKSYKKLFTAVLAAAVTTPAIVGMVPNSASAAEAKSFPDVKEGTYYYESVLNLTAREVINGYEDGTYRPGNAIKRGEAAMIIAAALNLDTDNVTDPGFEDVKTSAWYYGSVAALVEKGILEGYNEKTFNPNGTLKRSEMAKILTKAFSLKEESFTDKTFTDVKPEQWYSKYIQPLITNNITNGISANTFGPNEEVTRGQIATFVVRSEAAIIKESTIVNITETTVELADGTFELTDEMKKLLNPENLSALKNAVISFDLTESKISNVTSLEITQSGEVSEDAENPYAKHLVLDGNGASIGGNLVINGDYVSLKNMTIKGDLEIGSNVESSFYSENITVEGNTSIKDGEVVQSAGFSTASEAKSPLIIFVNANISSVDVSKQGATLQSKGTTAFKEINVSSNVVLKADEGVKIPKVTIKNGVTQVTIDAPVDNVSVNTNENITLNGTGSIKNVTVEAGKEVKLETVGKIGKIETKSSESKIAVGEKTTIGDVVVPEGSTVTDVINNYDNVKENIEKIGGADVKKPILLENAFLSNGTETFGEGQVFENELWIDLYSVNPDEIEGAISGTITFDEEVTITSALPGLEGKTEVVDGKHVFNWAFLGEPTLAEVRDAGIYRFDITATDAAGNAETFTVELMFDQVKPAFFSEAYLTNGDVQLGSGYVAEDGKKLTIDLSQVNPDEIEGAISGVINFTEPVTITSSLPGLEGTTEQAEYFNEFKWDFLGAPTLAEVKAAGIYSYDFTATDASGNAETFTVELVFDAEKPALQGGHVTAGEQQFGYSNLEGTKLTIDLPDVNPDKVEGAVTGVITFAEPVTITSSLPGLEGKTENVDGINTFNWAFLGAPTLAEVRDAGIHSFDIVATDAGGNSETYTIELGFDLTAPKLLNAGSLIVADEAYGNPILEGNKLVIDLLNVDVDNVEGAVSGVIMFNEPVTVSSSLPGLEGTAELVEGRFAFNWDFLGAPTLAQVRDAGMFSYDIVATDVAGNSETYTVELMMNTDGPILEAVNAAADVTAMQAALEAPELGLNLEKYNLLTDGGRKSAVAAAMLFAKTDGQFVTKAELQAAFDASVATETNKMNLIQLVNKEGAEVADLTNALHALTDDVHNLLSNTDDVAALDEFYGTFDNGLTLSQSMGVLTSMVATYDELSAEDKQAVFTSFQANPYNGSDAVVLGYVQTAINELVAIANNANTIELMQAALESDELGLNLENYNLLTDGGRKQAVADYAMFINFDRAFRNKADIQSVLDEAVATETNKMTLIQLVNKQDATVEDLTSVLNALQTDVEDFLDAFDPKAIDFHYGEGFSANMGGMITLVDTYNELTDAQKEKVFTKFQQNPYNGSDAVTIGYVQAAIEAVLAESTEQPEVTVSSSTLDLDTDFVIENGVVTLI